MARFSEAFLLLRSLNAGLPLALAPLVMVVMNIVYAVAAYPAGVLSDRMGRAVFWLSALLFSSWQTSFWRWARSIPAVMLGVGLWGLHMGFTQGLFATLVADNAPAHLRGTAFGVFNFVTGIAMLMASVIAGGLRDTFGPARHIPCRSSVLVPRLGRPRAAPPWPQSRHAGDSPAMTRVDR